MLGDVEETIYVVEEDEDEQETVKVSFKTFNLLRTQANCPSRQSKSSPKCCSFGVQYQSELDGGIRSDSRCR